MDKIASFGLNAYWDAEKDQIRLTKKKIRELNIKLFVENGDKA